MTAISSDLLRGWLDLRLAASGLRFEDLTEGDALGGAAQRLQAVVVLAGFDLTSFVHGAVDFVAGLSPQLQGDWYREFTRTLFFAGNPEALGRRFALDQTSVDGRIGFLKPAGAESHQNFKRLLKPLRTSGPFRPATLALTIEASTRELRRRRLLLATDGLRLEEYLIHLNHILCEAVIAGHLSQSDTLEVRHVPSITEVSDAVLCARVHRDRSTADALRLYGVLETIEASEYGREASGS